MTKSQPEQLSAEEPESPTLIEVEPLPPSSPRLSDAAVTLKGEAASSVRDVVGRGAVKAVELGSSATETTYRLIPSEAAKQGLADGSLRWANASKGDASVLIKDTASGRVAGHGELQKVGLSPAKVLGPALWEAMAMATQQHYLVEINAKLEAIADRVNEVLARDEDDKLGDLDQALHRARDSRARLSSGQTLSAGRVQALRDGAEAAGRTWHQLHRRAQRKLGEYEAGTASADEVESAWALLLYATQALTESSAVLIELPYETVEELQAATSEERERVERALSAMRELAAALHAAHLDWSAKNAEYRLQRTRNPARVAKQLATRSRPRKPVQQPLDYTTAWRASRLAQPPQPPPAVLVTVKQDGTVEVAAAQTAGGSAGDQAALSAGDC